jgi:hypothetical protein
MRTVQITFDWSRPMIGWRPADGNPFLQRGAGATTGMAAIQNDDDMSSGSRDFTDKHREFVVGNVEFAILPSVIGY